MYVASTVPNLNAGYNNVSLVASDFSVSPFILLPESFGDIFVGELFSAYIAVVNGVQDKQFDEVAMAIRLQTANATHDLMDHRPVEGVTSGCADVLQPNETTDMVVQHVISEVGVHTLRVSVQYIDIFSREPKTIRKFYRFNVMPAVEIKASVNEINDRYSVQYLVTNVMKSPIYIENAEIIGDHKELIIEKIEPPVRNQARSMSFSLESAPFLTPEESYSFSFLVNRAPLMNPDTGVYDVNCSHYKTLGVPVVTWSTAMGEHGMARGEELLTQSTHAAVTTNVVNTNTTPLPAAGGGTSRHNTPLISPALAGGSINAAAGLLSSDYSKGIRLKCLSVPGAVEVGEEFQVLLRVVNSTSQFIPIALSNRPAPASTSSLRALIPLSSAATDSFAGTNSSAGNAYGTMDHLCLVGKSHIVVGDIKPFSHVDVTLTYYAMSCGLQECRELVAIDTTLGKEYFCGSLFKILVTDPDQDTGMASE